jgi:hypothetical protein
MTGKVSARRGRAAQTETDEIADWLAIAEPAFSFWDNEVDDAYNSI